MTLQPIRLVAAEEHAEGAVDDPKVVRLTNDADPHTLVDRLADIERIDLDFPQFHDGRAFSQAFLLRRRLGFQGDIRATGDVLIDQLVQMERTGFSSAALKPGVDAADAQRQFERFPAFYQGDAVETAPLFARHVPNARTEA